jgi:hypothetical protein
MVWIEVKQRAYHEAFGLPDPPEGWFVTEDDHTTISPSVPKLHQP